jgi:hypothetical protein
METSINLFLGQVAVSRARSFLVYQFDMWLQHNLKVSLRRNKPNCCVLSRHSLRGSLRCPRNTVGRSPWCGSAEQQAYPPRMLRIAVSCLPSRKTDF